MHQPFERGSTTVQAVMTMIGMGAASMIMVSALVDRRRQQRRDLEHAGFISWSLISVVATLVAVYALVSAIRSSL